VVAVDKRDGRPLQLEQFLVRQAHAHGRQAQPLGRFEQLQHAVAFLARLAGCLDFLVRNRQVVMKANPVQRIDAAAAPRARPGRRGQEDQHGEQKNDCANGSVAPGMF